MLRRTLVLELSFNVRIFDAIFGPIFVKKLLSSLEISS